MSYDAFEKRRRRKIVFAVLAVAIIVSALVAMGLIYLGQGHGR